MAGKRRTRTRIAVCLSTCSLLLGCTAGLPAVEFDITAAPVGAQVDIAGCPQSDGKSAADCLMIARETALNPGESSVRAGWETVSSSAVHLVVNEYDKTNAAICYCRELFLNVNGPAPYKVTIASGNALAITCQNPADCSMQGDCTHLNVCH